MRCRILSSIWLALDILRRTKSVDEASKLGWVDANGDAIVSITLAAGETLDFVIDTGFDGELLLPVTLGESLKLRFIGTRDCVVVGGGIVANFTSLVEIDWLGTRHVADVLLSEGTDQLIGTALLQGTRLKIDYLANTVEIEKP